MRAKIDFLGDLFYERAGVWKFQLCPFARNEDTCCGDWCSLFGEPHMVRLVSGMSKSWSLELCQRTMYFDEIVDERGKETDDGH